MSEFEQQLISVARCRNVSRSYSENESSVQTNVVKCSCDQSTCSVWNNGTKSSQRAAGLHHHPAFKSQTLFMLYFFRNKVFTIPQNVLAEHPHSLMPFGRKGSHGSAGKPADLSHGCIVFERFCSWFHYNIISGLRIAWHNKLLFMFYHYPSSTALLLSLTYRTCIVWCTQSVIQLFLWINVQGGPKPAVWAAAVSFRCFLYHYEP